VKWLAISAVTVKMTTRQPAAAVAMGYPAPPGCGGNAADADELVSAGLVDRAALAGIGVLGYVPRRLGTRHAAAMAAHDPLPPLADQLLASLPGPTLSVVVRGQEDEQLLTPL
jgi:hypothetical protein